MKLDDLLARLDNAAIERSVLNDPDFEVSNVAFLTDWDAGNIRDDVIYFSKASLIPESIGENDFFNCIIQGPNGGEQLERCPNVNLIWLTEDANFFTLYNGIQALFLEDRDLTAATRKLLAAHFSNQGLQYLIEEAAAVLVNPIVVVDASYRYIAYHLGLAPDDDSPFAQTIRRELSNEMVLDEAVAYIRDGHIDSEIARHKGPYVRYDELLELNTMTQAVMVRGICVAHILMVEYTRAFSDLDREVFIRLGDFVSQELQKSELWGPTTGEMGSYFLENLINDSSPSAAVTNRRLKALNFHPKPLLFVFCFHAPGEGLSQIQAERIAAQLSPVLHHSLYTRHHQQLVAIISRDLDEGISERTELKVRDVAALNGLTVGVSNSFRSLTDTRQAYQQARTAIRLGNFAAGLIEDGGYYRYSDYTFLHMMSLAGRRTNLLHLCQPALLNLLEYDEAHGGELMDTLFCYLQVAGSTSRASQMLTLHKNTMLYRLGRIREVLGMNLSSGEDLFNLQVSFRILIHLGLFAPRMKLDRNKLIDEK